MKPEIVYTTLTPNKGTTPGAMQNGGVLDNNNVDNKNKGKAIQLGSLSEDDHQLEESASEGYDTTHNDESDPGSSPQSDSLLDPDALIYEDDSDHYGYEMELEEEEEEEEEEADDYVSEYQALFDAKEKELPAGVEVTMDWLPNSKSSGSNKSSREDHGIKLEATSSSKKPKKLPHNSKGFTPNSAYALPQIYLDPQAPVPVPAPAVPAPASSTVLLPTQNNPKGIYNARPDVQEVISDSNTCRVKRNMDDYLGKFVFFKRFDIVEDLVDHQYASKGTASKKHSKEWAKRIQEEWRTLENDLPEMIFVRAYESRMDLLRAVIIGADGTPYHDGLFFFDIFFPDTYPSVPPVVHYHSGGLRINPNLYNSGKVCLSLLGTWSGAASQMWIPTKSTMLQVLVSIQGLILNEKPYFNEPGLARTAGSPSGERQSKAYSENTFLLSLKTMVYNMRRPPKYFEDFSYGHFFSCAHDVLKACNAYRNRAPVASLVRGKVKEGDESNERCSEKFRTDVATFVDTILLKEFILLGVLGLEPEEEDKPSETKVAESSRSKRPKRGGVSSKTKNDVAK
ncbi:putative ubiquitin-conjugating enzyme E2 38 [Brassica rapa]|nr:putative ubiquitin-conjugating enzyme E2 38 [Brassica rapa]